MKPNIRQLKFSLPDSPFGGRLEEVRTLEQALAQLAGRAGTGNDKFRAAYGSLLGSIERGRDLENELDSPIKVRALALSLSTKYADRITLTQRILDKVDQIRAVPSRLLIQSVYQFYLKQYDKLGDYQAVGRWLLNSLPKRNLKQPFHDQLLADGGPKWLAQSAIREQWEFPNQVSHLGLDRFAAGRFMTVANNIYYVEQLKTIPVNQPHPLLLEVQKPSVYDAPYDEHQLLGHKVLEILISRAANTKVDDSWLNVVMAIAGDPRVPMGHPKYQKWWSQLDKKLHIVVQGWLSKLDLRLFLEALENFSNLPGKEDLRRMFPSRKKFLEGLDDKELVGHTRLYLSRDAERYLRTHYKPEHMPAYSVVSNGDKSLIYVQLANGQAHMVEGSHSCYLWLYKRLHDSAVVFDPGKRRVSYFELTSGLDSRMTQHNCSAVARITHQPVNFSWQRQALEALKKLGVPITPQDVLSQKDYQQYKRRFGVM